MIAPFLAVVQPTARRGFEGQWLPPWRAVRQSLGRRRTAASRPLPAGSISPLGRLQYDAPTRVLCQIVYGGLFLVPAQATSWGRLSRPPIHTDLCTELLGLLPPSLSTRAVCATFGVDRNVVVHPVSGHPWNVSTAQARETQDQIRGRVIVRPLCRPLEIVAGIDVSVKGTQARAAVVLLSHPGLLPLHTATAEMAVSFPYVPGLLAFREGPVVLAALAQLEHRPDLLMFDAQGIAHPRRVGLAAHLGVLLDIPAVGCAKSRLTGVFTEPNRRKGSWTPLLDGDEVIGAVLRTRDGVRPVFVSVGHRVDLETAVSLTLGCTTKYRLPEPTRWAHRVAGGASLPEVRQSSVE